MYAKFISKTEILPFSGKVLTFEGKTVINPSKIQLKQVGFLPCVGNLPFSAHPPRGHYYASDGDKITAYQVEEETKC